MSFPSNDEFLRAIFGADADNVYVTGFDVDPGKGAPWTGKNWHRWTPAERAGMPGMNTYYTVSTFDPDAGGNDCRHSHMFRSAHVLVVDDVGDKIPLDRMPNVAPTYKLETSPGNFHYGYALSVPEEDDDRWTALVDGVIAKLTVDGTDPGMRGVTRNVRLPNGKNTKAKYGTFGFHCLMHEWNPGLKFTIEELAEIFTVKLPAAGAHGGVGDMEASEPQDDDVYNLLNEWGMVKRRKATGLNVYHIECPWLDEHSDGGDSGAAYTPGSWFTCHHGHCKDRHWRELSQWVHAKSVSLDGPGVDAWNFTLVHGYERADAPAIKAPERTAAKKKTALKVDFGKAGEPETDFFEEFIFVSSQDKFFSVRTGDLLTRDAVNAAWCADILPPKGIKNPTDLFLSHVNKLRARRADALTYWPGEAVWFREGGSYYANTWREPTDYPFSVSDNEVQPWLDLVQHIVGGEGQDAVDWVLDWMALIVGEPGRKPGWHLIVQGPQGLGKDLMLQPLRAGVGPDNYGTTNAKSLFSDFNSWAEKRLVIVNELHQGTRGSGAEQYTTLKELTENTNPTIRINQKYTKEYYARNVSGFVVTSNDEKAVALEADDRRFLVVMSKVTPWSEAKFEKVTAWMNGDGARKTAAWLKERWEGLGSNRQSALNGRAPMTAGKSAMIANNADVLIEWMREQIEDGVWTDLMTADEITDAIVAAERMGRVTTRGVSPQRWARVLSGLGGGKVYNGGQVRLKNGQRVRLWATKNVSHFDKWDNAMLAGKYAKKVGDDFKEEAEATFHVLKSETEKVSETS